MGDIQETLAWIEAQRSEMIETVIAWARINSGSNNEAGMQKMESEARSAFERLGGMLEESDGLLLRKRPEAEVQVLLVGHLDTVYPYDSPFQEVKWLDEGRLQGPGVTDMKGGLVVMLKVLEAVERAEVDIGWTLYLSKDEEIGSPQSRATLEKLAPQFNVGLAFEPTLANDEMASARKGSANFTVTTQGLAAHAGRHFFEGKSAIHCICDFVTRVTSLCDREKDVTVNVGKIGGGSSPNTVAENAACTVNIRAPNNELIEEVCNQMEAIAHGLQTQWGITFEISGGTTRPPKILTREMQQLLDLVKGCGEEIGVEIGWRETGGVSDGNNLAAAGLPTLDTMGVRGRNIHSDREMLFVDSLVERAKLAFLLLTKLGASE